MTKQSTANKRYTDRLVRLGHKKWKKYLQVQKPYQYNLKRLRPGKTLDIGCGIGRYLEFLPIGSVGIDHNEHSINKAKLKGLMAYTIRDFKNSTSNKNASFDSLLLSHVLEHMTMADGLKLIREYMTLLKPMGKLIIFCPQEKGYKSDDTHVAYLDSFALQAIIQEAGFEILKSYSFPLPKAFGKIFTHNEFVVVGQKNSKIK